jgi:very-short-patch-repair endonuclease
MPNKKIITGQHIQPQRAERARQLRREMTPAEAMLWQRLRAGRLDGFHFRRQQVIGPFIVDFYCHQTNLVVELDGSVHLKQEAYDRERERYLNSHGLRVLRFTNTDVNGQMHAVMAAILKACKGAELEDEHHA